MTAARADTVGGWDPSDADAELRALLLSTMKSPHELAQRRRDAGKRVALAAAVTVPARPKRARSVRGSRPPTSRATSTRS